MRGLLVIGLHLSANKLVQTGKLYPPPKKKIFLQTLTEKCAPSRPSF